MSATVEVTGKHEVSRYGRSRDSDILVENEVVAVMAATFFSFKEAGNPLFVADILPVLAGDVVFFFVFIIAATIGDVVRSASL